MDRSMGELGAWVTTLVGTLGYLGVAIAVALEVFIPLIPSTVVLPLAGFLANRAQLSFLGVVAAATLGSVVGALGFYALGRAVGEERLRELLKRLGRWRLLTQEDLDRAKGWFDEHGGRAVLLARFVPPVRSPVSVAAGLARLPLGRFAALAAAGSAVWDAAFLGLGWLLGDRWDLVQRYATALQWAAVTVGVLGTAWFIWRRLRRPA